MFGITRFDGLNLEQLKAELEKVFQEEKDQIQAQKLEIEARKIPRNEALCVRPVDMETINKVFETLAGYKEKFPERVVALDEKITEYCKDTIETKEDVEMKTKVHKEIEKIVEKVFGDRAELLITGSTQQGLCVKGGDLDLSLICETDGKFLHTDSERVLSSLQTELQRCEMVSSVEHIRTTKFPLLRMQLDNERNNLKVDISCNQIWGLVSAHLIRHYVMFDARVQPLIVALKNWSLKAHIRDHSYSRINSFSIVMMAIHYLQSVCSPPILPNLSELCPKICKSLPESHELCVPEEIKSKIEPNGLTVGLLFLGCMVYYSLYDWKCAISVRLGERFEKNNLESNNLERIQCSSRSQSGRVTLSARVMPFSFKRSLRRRWMKFLRNTLLNLRVL